MMPTQFQHMFPKDIERTGFDAIRARPGQRYDAASYPIGLTPNAASYIAAYALSTWAYTAVQRFAESASLARFEIVARDDPMDKRDDHPLSRLLGAFGQPNDYQSTMEFWREHFTYFALSGNSYWYWSARSGGAPDEVYLLHPASMRIVPGRDRTIARYEYLIRGRSIPIPVEHITHFRSPNPYNIYYGLPAFEALMRAVLADYNASTWNQDFFGDDVSVPAGILVLPPDTKDAERDRIADELSAKHGSGRRTAIARVPAGGSAWFDTPLNRREMDFAESRLMSRQETYEALGLPLGYLSEASTEAHARVAERQWLYTVYGRLQYVADKINPQVLQFWGGWNRLAAQFDDIRKQAADWDQQRHRYAVLSQVLTPNEIRIENGFKPVEGGDNEPFASDRQAQDSGDTGPVQSGGQVPDMVEPGE